MEQIYLDNAATSYPKPAQVAEQMAQYITQVGATINRSVYGRAQQAAEITLELRIRLAKLFGVQSATHVILTPGNTWGLNMLLFGALKPGDHCIVSAMEHNAVMRPLQHLTQKGIMFDRIRCDAYGRIDLHHLESLIQQNTRLVMVAHGSNVCGTVQDAKAIGEICNQHEIPFCLDAAQTAGHIPIDFAELGLSALSIPAHKGLMGPQGIGALLLKPDFAKTLEPWVHGGTGSASHEEVTPNYMPDRFEPGTPNMPGIFGWNGALQYLEEVGLEQIMAHEKELCEYFLQELAGIKGVKLVGMPTTEQRTGVFSLDFSPKDNAEVARQLEDRYGILTRCGLHCAPSAHKTLGTFPNGTVRFSFGWFTTKEQVQAALKAIRELV